MGNRTPLIASLFIVAGMAAASAWAWPLISETAPLAIHWNIHGAPDGYASKSVALLVLPGVALALTAICSALSFAGSERMRAGAENTAYRVAWIGSLLVLAVAHAVIILAARGVYLDVSGNSAFVVALLMTVLGNFLGKTRPNRYVGVRTKWTFESDYAWEKSNRLGGRLLVAVGLATLGALAVTDTASALYILIGGVIAAALICIAMSYYYWARDPDRRSAG